MDKHDRRGFDEKIPVFKRRNAATRHEVHEVQASVAKTHFSQLLDDVERGATIVILRHGRPIARVIPDPEARQRRINEAIDNIKALGRKIREETGGATLEEILAWRHEGHKY